ncbi:hypothetical protein BDY19DRAFT_995536 [Irpex rosettiformis]|uniref:Uncharacterized protein n=1 Tax=Irpex rosettiformis TaxID=378272 RepID=A0ACB8TXS9_9APHY|nr:hypothetical protein BDY19DRAFT_995536 [Irpex rosettiformis]
MSLPTENPIILDLGPTFGVMLIGNVLSFALWGVICMQAFLYYSTYPNDSTFTKVFIFALWAMDTASVVLGFVTLWHPLVQHWGSIEAVNANVYDLLHSDWIAAIVTTSVQFFFLWRIYRLGGHFRWKWGVIVFVVIAGLYQLAAGIAFDVIGFQGTTLASANKPILRRLQLSDRSLTAAIDIVICMSLVKLLLQNGIPTYYKTRALLYRGIIVTINSGLWTAILAVIDLILMAAQPSQLYYCIIELPIQSFYVVTLLSNLNARGYVRGKETEWTEYLSVLPDESRTAAMSSGSDGNASGNYKPRKDAYVLKEVVVSGESEVESNATRRSGTSGDDSKTGLGSQIAFAKPGTVEYQ